MKFQSSESWICSSNH